MEHLKGGGVRAGDSGPLEALSLVGHDTVLLDLLPTLHPHLARRHREQLHLLVLPHPEGLLRGLAPLPLDEGLVDEPALDGEESVASRGTAGLCS